MVTIDLTTPPPPPTTFLDAMARRLALTLPELRLVAELAGGAPLPFDVPGAEQTADAGSLSGRLGQSRGSLEDSAYSKALGTLHDPEDTLRQSASPDSLPRYALAQIVCTFPDSAAAGDNGSVPTDDAQLGCAPPQ